MKILDIAFKDVRRYFRSGFALVMMFVAPLLITGLLYLAFGNTGKSADPQNAGQRSAGTNIPAIRLQIVNLDQSGGGAAIQAGNLLADYFLEGDMAGMIQAKTAPDEASARGALSRREADIALIIPADLTQAVLVRDAKATVTLLHDPTLTVGPSIIKTIVADYLDGFSGTKIAVQVASDQMSARGLQADDATTQAITQGYVGWIQAGNHASEGGTSQPGLVVRPPATGSTGRDVGNSIIGSVMAGMMIVFVFFTGAASASSIVYETEGGTLARLLTTPTPAGTILGGKLAAVVITLVIQVLVLMAAASLLFGIRWGSPAPVALVVAGTVIAAAGFGVLLMSLVKSTRQSGPVMGLVVTVTGMLGGTMTVAIPNMPSAFQIVNLTMPQGWALRGFKLAVTGASAGQVLLPAAVLACAGIVFFAAGGRAFRQRFA